MYNRPAIINNYRTTLFEEPLRGLRNLVAGNDNSGNILFLETIGNQINDCTPINIWDEMISQPEHFLQTYDVLVLPMANMISETWSSPNILKTLEAHPIPVVLVSIGLQTEDDVTLLTLKMSPDCKRLLDIAKDRSQTIGVRGKRTAEFLDGLGYPVDIIGCPSLFGPAESIKPLTNPSRIATHCTLHGDWRAPIRNLFEFSWKYAQGYVAQSELRLLVDRYNVTDAELREWISSPDRLASAMTRLFEYSYYADTDPTPEELRAWFLKNLVYFIDIDAWKAYLSNFDFVVGSRFHGSVIATLAGTPSLLLTTDIRVQELAEYHKLPSAPISVMHRGTTPQELVQYVDYSAYEAFASEAKQHYRDFLISNGLTPSGY